MDRTDFLHGSPQKCKKRKRENLILVGLYDLVNLTESMDEELLRLQGKINKTQTKVRKMKKKVKLIEVYLNEETDGDI